MVVVFIPLEWEEVYILLHANWNILLRLEKNSGFLVVLFCLSPPLFFSEGNKGRRLVSALISTGNQKKVEMLWNDTVHALWRIFSSRVYFMKNLIPFNFLSRETYCLILNKDPIICLSCTPRRDAVGMRGSAETQARLKLAWIFFCERNNSFLISLTICVHKVSLSFCLCHLTTTETACLIFSAK